MEGISHMVTLRTFRREAINDCFQQIAFQFDSFLFSSDLLHELRKYPNVIGQLYSVQQIQKEKIPRVLLPVSNPKTFFQFQTEKTWKLETQQSPKVQRPRLCVMFQTP
jgi:hypothetical protein